MVVVVLVSLGLGGLTSPIAAQATPASFSGYFRARGQFYRDRDLDTKTEPSSTMFVDQRLKLDTEVALTDEVKAAVQWDILDNLVWGLNGQGLYDLTDIARSDFANREATVEDAVHVRRVWGEFITPIGILAIGRQPVHWGLGVLYNDGNCLTCDFGDTQDRVLFSTKVGPVVVSPFLAKIIEGPIEEHGGTGLIEREFLDDGETSLRTIPSTDADAGDLGVGVTYYPKPYEVGLLLNTRFQKAQPFRGKLAILDVYGKGDVVFLHTEGEGVFVNGDGSNAALEPQRTDVFQMGVTGLAYWTRPYLHFGVEYALATGPGGDEYVATDPDRWEGREQREFRFDPDYNVGLILFDEVINAGVVREGFRQINAGRVRNANVIKAFWFGDWKFVEPRASILTALATKKISGKRYMGLEIDAEGLFRIRGGFQALAQLGVLFPGAAAKAYLGSERSSPALMFKLGTFFKF